MTAGQIASARYEVADALQAIEFYFEKGWTDGLPVVPPTEARVREFLDRAGRAPDEVVGRLDARRRVVTAEKVAINAVMAGCLPEYLPVVIAAVEAMSEDPFNLHGISASTGGAAVLVIVHGPIAADLGVNSGVNIFGPGNRANATIGRAVRLVLMNCFGAQPGLLDKATIGHPGKYTYCIAEDEAGSPWEPLHVARGLPAHQSAVTVFAAEGPHQVYNETATTPERILDTYAASLRDAGNLSGPLAGEYLVLIVPQHYRYIAAAGWGRRRIQEYLFERARVTVEDFERAGKAARRVEPGEAAPVVAAPEDFLVMAGGGNAGGMAAVIPPWLGKSSRAVTRAVGGSRE
jgi:hypothetical protein